MRLFYIVDTPDRIDGAGSIIFRMPLRLGGVLVCAIMPKAGDGRHILRNRKQFNNRLKTEESRGQLSKRPENIRDSSVA